MIDYTDQGIYVSEFGDRRVTTAYTTYGIRCIDSNYCERIKNIHNESISDGFEHLEFIATESNISEDILENANRALRMLLATKDEVND